MDIRDVRFVRSAPTWAVLPEDGRAEIALVGRSNVGKSSLLNYLVGRRAIAHTSGTPGKTTALNYYLVNSEEGASGERAGGFYLVDLPGYGYAKASQAQRAAWQRLIGHYVTEREPLRLVFHLMDSRHPPTRLDEELLAVLGESPADRVILLTKSDKLSRSQQQRRVAELRRYLGGRGLDLPVVLTSAEKRQGADEVWRWAELLANVSG